MSLLSTARIRGAGAITMGTTTISGGTAGSVLFVGTGGVIQQDNANFFWNDTTNTLIIGGVPTGTMPTDTTMWLEGGVTKALRFGSGSAQDTTKGGYIRGNYDNGRPALTIGVRQNTNDVDTLTLYHAGTGDARVGIGTGTPGYLLTIQGSTTTALQEVAYTGASGSTSGGGIRVSQNDGTVMASGEQLGTYSFGGYNGTSVVTGAYIKAIASDTVWSGTKNGTEIHIFTTAANGGTITPTASLKITALGLQVGGNFSSTALSIFDMYQSTANAYNSIFYQTGASSATNGAGLSLFIKDGAATESGHQLGRIDFRGGTDGSGNSATGASIQAFTTELFSSTTVGTQIKFFTTPNGSTTNTLALTLGQDQLATFAGQISVAGTLTGSGSLLAGATFSIGWNGRAVFKSPSTSSITARNSADTAYASIQASLYIGSTQALSGAGAADVITETTKITTTGVADAITLADGVDGQTKTILHDVDGGSFVLTPTTATGWSTFTSTVAGESITLKFVTTRGWIVIGSYLGVIA